MKNLYMKLGNANGGDKLRKMYDQMIKIEKEFGTYQPHVTEEQLQEQAQKRREWNEARRNDLAKTRIISEFRRSRVYKELSHGYNTADIDQS